MPTYVYRCRDCDHYFEVVQSMSDDPVTFCDACGGEVARVMEYADAYACYRDDILYADA